MLSFNEDPIEWCKEKVKNGIFANNSNCMDKMSASKGGKRTRRHNKRAHKRSTRRKSTHKRRTHKRRY